ncbi:peptide chain release factor APG3, chloroplastic, partial [Aduncisulcus paluster]
GINGVGNVDYVVVVKAAHNVKDCLSFADVAEEFVAEAFTLACAFNQTCNGDKINGGLLHALGINQLGQLVDALVRDGHNSLVGFDGTESVVCAFRVLGFGQGVEKCGFTDVGQSHDTDTESHNKFS